jgi:hypothetical protein
MIPWPIEGSCGDSVRLEDRRANRLINWLNDNQGAAIVLLTAVLVGITTWSAPVAHWALDEAKNSRQDAVRPVIAFELEQAQTKLNVMNVGVGPALETLFSSTIPTDIKRDIAFDSFRDRGVIASGEKEIVWIRADFTGLAMEHALRGKSTTVEFKITYCDAYGRRLTSRANLQISPQLSLGPTIIQFDHMGRSQSSIRGRAKKLFTSD